MEVVIIVAAAENNVIGRDGGIPWHISEDLKRFKRITKGHACLMGRKTFESLPKKPFAHRRNLIISGNFEFDHPDVRVFPSIPQALEASKEEERVFICGGAGVYKAAMEFADRILLTRVHDLIEGDTIFPDISSKDWTLCELEHHDYYTFLTYERKKS